MKGNRNKLVLLIILCIVFLFSESGICLITGERGSRPIEDRGWPAGSTQVANLPSRLGYWEGPPFGGGEYHFLYRCQNTDEFNEAMRTFANVQASKLELVVHNGPEYSFWLKEENEPLSAPDNRVDWTFTIWNPQNWNHLNNTSRTIYRLPDSDIQKPVPRAKKPVPAPKVDVYIGGNCPIIWKDVKMPKKLTVIDKSPGSVNAKLIDTGLIRGKVFDRRTKKPIAAATLVLLNQVEIREASESARATSRSVDYDWKKLMQNTTGTDGSCQIEKIPLGIYKIHITAEGYAPVELERYDNRIPEIYEFEVCLSKAGNMKGIVVDTSGKPLGGVAVSARDFVGVDGNEYPFWTESPVVTDKLGRFSIEDLPEGFAGIRCNAAGFHQKNSIFEMYPIPSDKLKLIMEGTGTVRGKVLTEKGNIPSGQIVLEIETPGEEKIGKWGYSGYLGKDGTFNISGIPPGEYIITTRPNPSSANYKPYKQKIVIEPGKTYEIEILHVE
jgi:hypothetical protein